MKLPLYQKIIGQKKTTIANIFSNPKSTNWFMRCMS